MDRDRSQSAPRKLKYAPKPSAARRPSRAVRTKTDGDDGKDKVTHRSLSRRVHEHQTNRGPNVDKKSSEHGDASFTKLEESIADTDSDEEYKEPWDYKNSNYPITLPLRKPNSGDPELVDKKEFEEAPPYDENAISSASELGLLAENKDDKAGMFFFEFPPSLPRSSNAERKELCSLEDLPEGYLGKMQVYKSGAIKMKLGDVVYDVSHGGDVTQQENVVAINKKEGHCCVLGDVIKKAVVSLDVDSILQDKE